MRNNTNTFKNLLAAALTIAALAAGHTTAWAQSTENLGGYDFTVVTDGNDSYYIVDCKEALNALATYVNGTDDVSIGKTFRQTANIDMSSVNNFDPIGSVGGSKSFRGTYDGGNFTISNLTVSNNYGAIGLFGMIKDATIRNIVLVSPTVGAVNPGVNEVCLGALIGVCDKISGTNTVDNCHVISPTLTVSGTSSGTNNIGAIIGEIYNTTTVTNCYYYSNATEYAAIGKYDSDATLTNVARVYQLTLNDCTAATADLTVGTAKYCKEGTIVTLTITPATGFNIGTVKYNDGTDHIITPTNDVYSFTMPASDVTVSATFTVTTSYVDASGTLHENVIAIPLDNTMTTLAAGWYVVNENVDYTGQITLSGDVTLILGDGCTMSFGKEGELLNATIIECNNHNLTIYGQSGGTGWLKAYIAQDDGIHNVYYTQYSGNVLIFDGNGACIYAREFTILGGTLDVVSGGGADGEIVTTGDINIRGGKLWARCKGLKTMSGMIILDYTNATDEIYAYSYQPQNGLQIADGKTLVDDYGVIWSGALYNNQIEHDINRRTLKPLDYTGVTLTKEYYNVSATFDGTSTTTVSIPVDVNVTSVTYERTFTDGKPSTVMLPFSLGEGQTLTGGTLYKFTGVTKNETAGKWEATMTETATLQANTPYLLMPDENLVDGKVTFNLGSSWSTVTLNTTGGGNEVTSGSWKLVGSYTSKTWAAEDPEIRKAYFINNEGALEKIEPGMVTLPTSCYLLREVESLTAKAATVLGENKYVTTFYGTLDYQLPEGAKAYTASLDNSKIVFHQIGEDGRVIPHGTAVIIAADIASITLTLLASTDVTAYDGNILQGSDTAVTVTEGKVDGKTPYVLGIDSSSTLGFYKFSGATIPAGKAYYLKSE